MVSDCDELIKTEVPPDATYTRAYQKYATIRPPDLYAPSRVATTRVALIGSSELRRLDASHIGI
jgi:hypothetical protein